MEEWKEKRQLTYAIIQNSSLDLVVVKAESEDRLVTPKANTRAAPTEIEVETKKQSGKQKEPVRILFCR